MPAVSRAFLILVGAALIIVAVVFNWSDIASWAQAEQRSMQTQLARALQAIRAGDDLAVAGLISACLIYGLLHAVGPGHGKFLIGSAAVASRRTAWRMAGIGFSASLMQAITAIVLAYGGLGLAATTGSVIVGNAERLLMPISFAAMALVGVWIILRGLRMIRSHTPAHVSVDIATDKPHPHIHDHAQCGHQDELQPHNHNHNHHAGECAAGCKHMPTIDETERLESWRDVAALVLSIGIRPCSGALIVLIISWHFGLYVVGALGAVAMAVGTGLIVSLVALFATAVRDTGFLQLSSNGDGLSAVSFGRLQVVAGSLVVIACLSLMIGSTPGAAPMGLIR